jgi:ABC-type glycerol-3-phosphate transport system permease component
MTRFQRRWAGRLLTFGLLCMATGLLALPFFWMVATSLKPLSEVTVYPPTWWPSEIRWSNYAEAWNAAPFGRFYVNSLVAGIGATALQVLLAFPMAYAFARIPFPGKGVLFMAILATMMIPEEMKLVPNYLLLRWLGWIDSYAALILPPAAHAFPVFVLYQQFRLLPQDLFDAATVDGAGHLRVLWQIAAPLSRPMVAAVTLIAFLGRWNDYLWPLIVTNTTTMRTLPIGLAYLKASQEEGNRWDLLMAAAVFIIVPVLLLYVVAQRHFVEGIVRGALKG